MWLFLVLPSVVFATFESYSFFTDHRNKNLDHNVSPCHNFFKHVCKPDLPYRERLQQKLVDRFNDMLKPYEPKLGQMLKREIQKRIGPVEIDPLFLRSPDVHGDWEIPGFPPRPPVKTSPFPPTTTEENRATTTEGTATSSVQPSTTEDDRTTTTEEPETQTTARPTTPGKQKDVDNLLYKLCPVFIHYKLCTDPQKFAEIMLAMRKLHSQPGFAIVLTEKVLAGVMTHEAFQRYIKDHPDFLGFQPQVDKLFHYAKSSVMKEFQSTPWIRKKNQEKLFKALEETSMIKINGTYSSIVPSLEASYKELKNCPRSDFDEYIVCIMKSILAIVNTFSELNGDFETFIYVNVGARRFNAMYIRSTTDSPPKIYAFPPLLGPFYEGIPETLGSAGTILGHELGHITTVVNDTAWPIERSCFEGHRDDVCMNEFQSCKPASHTFTEDIADYVSMQAILSLFKEHFPQATKEDYQRLFYAHAYSWCDDGANDLSMQDKHSAHIVRANGVLRLFDEFSVAFDCKKGDYMRTEREERCSTLVGSNAPNSRKK